MNPAKFLQTIGALAVLSFAADQAVAGPVSCTSAGAGVSRTWTVDAAQPGCVTVGGNATASDVGTAFGGTWTEVGEATSALPSGSGLLSVTGFGGGTNESGTFSLGADFWATYTAAAISIHVGGNPQEMPDDSAIFLLTPNGDLNAAQAGFQGRWAYLQEAVRGAGGGLSNIKLYVQGRREVPEPMTLGLLGLGLLGAGIARRRKA